MNKYLEKIAEQDSSESHPLRNTASAIGLGAVAALGGGLGGEMLGKKLLPHAIAAQPRMTYREAKKYLRHYGRKEGFKHLEEAKNMEVPPMPRWSSEENSYYDKLREVKNHEDAVELKAERIHRAKYYLRDARRRVHYGGIERVMEDGQRFENRAALVGAGVAGTAGMVGGYRLSHGPFGDKESQ